MPLNTLTPTPTYTPSSLSSAKQMQNQVFGDYTRTDMAPFTSAAMNYIMQQQQNAYELELWNLANKYNSPDQQMTRFQEAGLNPNLIYSQQNSSPVAGSSNPIPTKPTNYKAQNTSSILQAAGSIVGNINNLLSGVRDMYDYAKYGEKKSNSLANLAFFQSARSQQEANTALYDSWIKKVLTGNESLDTVLQSDFGDLKVRDVPIISRYLAETSRIDKEAERIQYFLDQLGPAQVANYNAGTELRQSEKGWNDNIREFVGSINTGIPWLDQLIRAVMRVALGRN